MPASDYWIDWVQTGWYETPQVKRGSKVHRVPRWRKLWKKERAQIDRMRKGKGWK